MIFFLHEGITTSSTRAKVKKEYFRKFILIHPVRKVFLDGNDKMTGRSSNCVFEILTNQDLIQFFFETA